MSEVKDADQILARMAEACNDLKEIRKEVHLEFKEMREDHAAVKEGQARIETALAHVVDNQKEQADQIKNYGERIGKLEQDDSAFRSHIRTALWVASAAVLILATFAAVIVNGIMK